MRGKINGFTLLEMLVVIGIIGILVGLGAVSYSTVQKKSRDAKRKNDLKIIQNSLEQYYSICGYKYPTPTTGSIISSIICTSPSVAIMPTAPTDPKTGSSYSITSDGTTYSICVPTRVATPPVFESETVTSYCLESQQ